MLCMCLCIKIIIGSYFSIKFMERIKNYGLDIKWNPHVNPVMGSQSSGILIVDNYLLK